MTAKQILGVKFLSGNALEAVDAGLRGGLVVVPSAPVLVGIADDPALRAAVLGADLAITDSGLMVLMWWLLKREKLERVSGLEYLKLLLQKLKPETADLKPEGLATNSGLRSQVSGLSAHSQVSGLKSQVSYAAGSGVFWIMPTAGARDQNLAWLRSQGFVTTMDDCYVAPHYGGGQLHDEALLALVRTKKPAHVIIALGGGVQERLGFSLREALRAESEEQSAKGVEQGAKSKAQEAGALTTMPHALGSGPCRPGIHCIGAAIGFLSGEQVRIPMWVDYLYLGWLWRSVSAPGKFLPRYWKATRLVGLMIRYREKPPVAEAKS